MTQLLERRMPHPTCRTQEEMDNKPRRQDSRVLESLWALLDSLA